MSPAGHPQGWWGERLTGTQHYCAIHPAHRADARPRGPAIPPCPIPAGPRPRIGGADARRPSSASLRVMSGRTLVTLSDGRAVRGFRKTLRRNPPSNAPPLATDLPPDPASAEYPVRLTFRLPDSILTSPGPQASTPRCCPATWYGSAGAQRGIASPWRENSSRCSRTIGRLSPAAPSSPTTMIHEPTAATSPWFAGRW
jgi:hypothetical protein